MSERRLGISLRIVAAAVATLGVPIYLLLAQATKPFPAHWGQPPAIQTQDYIELPAGYGHGSSTLARWIEGNLEKDKHHAGSDTSAKPKPLYENNFEKAGLGKLPEDFLVLNGEFAVKEVDGNKFLELPGTPLESFGVLFGPGETSGAAVSARISGTAKGRRYPAFGVGLGGVSGYRLQMSPGKKAVELFKDQEVRASVPYDWKSGVWTLFRLQVYAVKEGAWRIEGKAWPLGSAEPKDWLIAFEEKEEPVAGRASIFASPFSGTPIWFDDLAVERVGK